MCNHASPGPPNPALSPAESSETSHLVSWWNCGFAQTNNFFINCQNPSQGILIFVLVILTRFLTWLQFGVVTDFSGQMLTFYGHWHAGWISVSTVLGRWQTQVWHRVGERFADVIVCPIVAVGLCHGQAYATDIEHNCILLMAIWMHRHTVSKPWGPLSCHSSATIPSYFSMIMHGPMSQGSVHKSWKLKMSQFFHFLHTHQTCHRFGIAIEEEWDNIPQGTINNLIKCMWRSAAWGEWMVVAPDTDSFSYQRPYNLFKVSVTDKCIDLYSQSWNA